MQKLDGKVMDLSTIMQWRRIVLIENPFDLKKTTDPEARDFARSVELFRHGIKVARAGDLTTGKSKIAAAFLLDGRCSRALFPIIFPGDPDAPRYLLDYELLNKLLCAPSPSSESMFDSSTAVLLHMKLRKCAGRQSRDLQLNSSDAVLSSKNLLDSLKSNSSLENHPDINDGCLTRTRIRILRCDHFVQNQRMYKKAVKELDHVLKDDPSNTFVRAKRAKMHYQYRGSGGYTMEIKTIFNECKRVVCESHPDARHLRHIYAIMSDLALDFPECGTFVYAKSYFNKMEGCEKRQIELYTKLGVELECQTCFVTEARFKFGAELTEERIRQRISKDVNSVDLDDSTTSDTWKITIKYLCMNCDKGKYDGLKLSKCGGCKQVAYCSRECQKADWKNHKSSCNLFQKGTKKKV